MKRELKQLQLAKKEHSKALKKNVNCPLQALFTSFSIFCYSILSIFVVSLFVCSCCWRHSKRESCDRWSLSWRRWRSKRWRWSEKWKKTQVYERSLMLGRRGTCVCIYTLFNYMCTIVYSVLFVYCLACSLFLVLSFSQSTFTCYVFFLLLSLRELSKMRKENRKKEHLIKSLQADARKKEVILKRKQDEVISILSTSRATQHVWSLTLASPERVA